MEVEEQVQREAADECYDPSTDKHSPPRNFATCLGDFNIAAHTGNTGSDCETNCGPEQTENEEG